MACLHGQHGDCVELEWMQGAINANGGIMEMNNHRQHRYCRLKFGRLQDAGGRRYDDCATPWGRGNY